MSDDFRPSIAASGIVLISGMGITMQQEQIPSIIVPTFMGRESTVNDPFVREAELTSEYDTSSNRPRMDDYNGWADFWRYKIGVNVIPAIVKEKRPVEKWKNDPLGNWQVEPIPEWRHNEWKSNNEFKDGMAIITGKVWHREDKEGYYLVAGDSDNQVATNEITNDLMNCPLFYLRTECRHEDGIRKWCIPSTRSLILEISFAMKGGI